MAAGRLPAALAVLTLAGAVAVAGAQPRVALSAEANAALSQYLTAAVARGDAPAAVALVVGRDRVLYEGAFGKQDVARGVPMSRDTIFRIASMTKPVTSVAVMMLVDAGKIRLDDPVGNYLPGYEGAGVIQRFEASAGTYDVRPPARATTIRHLLTHTSGIGYAWSSPVLARLQQATQKTELELPRLHDPGDKWTYGASTRVLGQVVEKVSGQPLDTFLRERIFAPLQMTDTAYTVPAAKVPRVVTIHRRTGATLAEVPNADPLEAVVRGDGGLYGTAQDYGRFIQLFLNRGTAGGTRLLSEASITAMGTNHIGAVVVSEQPAADAARSRPYPLGAGRDKFGLGFQIAAAPGEPGMRSPGSLSWGGINNTHFWIDPQREIGVVLLMQVLPFYDDRAIAVLRDVERLVYRHLH
jgi:methyl acetate hydrolase